MYEDMNFPLMTSIFCSSLLQGVFRRRFQPSIQLLYPSYSSILFNFLKIFEKSSGSSLLFVGRGGASWSGLQVCVLLYIFFLFLCELSKERSEAAVLHQLISIITSFWWRQGVQIVERARERQEGTEKNEDHEDKTSSLSPNHFSGLIFPNLISLSCWDLTRREIGKCKKLQKLTYLISCAHRTKKNGFQGTRQSSADTDIGLQSGQELGLSQKIELKRQSPNFLHGLGQFSDVSEKFWYTLMVMFSRLEMTRENL